MHSPRPATEQSFEADRANPSNRQWLAPGSARRRLFRSLRLLLPMLAAVLLGLALLLPGILSRSGRAPIDVAVVEQGREDEAKGMVNITYSGVDKQGRAFSLFAERVNGAAAATDVLLLTRPSAEMSLRDGA